MTRATNARIAGFTFLFYIAVALPAMILLDEATSGQGIAEKLAGIAQHATEVRVSIVLSLLSCFCALVLAVTMYRLTREQDADLAMLALTCRVGEGVNGGISILATLGLLWLGTATTARAPGSEAAPALATFLLNLERWNPIISASFFALGSTLFSWLLLRGRMVPIVLAWLGVGASVLLVITLPLNLAGFLDGRVTGLMWFPMLVFEVALAFWLLIKGVRAPLPE